MSASAQQELAKALLDPGRPAPRALAPSGGAAPAKRFAVYRNNVMVSLVGALETRFPVARRIVGEAFFAGLAYAYARENPPRSPLMTTYGDGFADFVERAPGLEDVAYLADVVRLEAARTRAYHAADAEPIGAEAFAALDPETLDRVTVRLHPAVEIVRSAYPVATIWEMNAGAAEPGPIEDWRGEDALVARPALDVVVRRLAPGQAGFLGALRRGLPLGAAAEAAEAETAEFDLSDALSVLIAEGLAAALGEAIFSETTSDETTPDKIRQGADA